MTQELLQVSCIHAAHTGICTQDLPEASFLPLYLIVFEGFFISGLAHLFSGLFCALILMLRETDAAPAHPQQLSWILP